MDSENSGNNGQSTVCKGLPYIIVHQDFPLYLVGPLSPPRFCPAYFSRCNFQVLQAAISQQFCSFWHERPTLSGARAEMIQKPISSRWPNGPLHRCACANLCFGKMFMMYSALLQHSCSRLFPESFMLAPPCWPITPFHTSASFPTFALKSLNTVLLSFKLCRISLASYIEFKIHLQQITKLCAVWDYRWWSAE